MMRRLRSLREFICATVEARAYVHLGLPEMWRGGSSIVRRMSQLRHRDRRNTACAYPSSPQRIHTASAS